MTTEQNQNLIGKNEFYLLIQKSGYYMKTSFFEDYDDVCSWEQNNDLVFSGVVKNCAWIHLRLGQTWMKKRVSQLLVSKPQSEVFWYDVNELDLKFNSHITKVEKGGKEKPEIIQPL